MARTQSSRRRYREFLERRQEQRKAGDVVDRRGRPVQRHRTLRQLIVCFWALVGNQRRPLLFSLVLLTGSVLFGLLPLYAPKIVVDHVLGTEPVPRWINAILPAQEGPRALLVALVVVALVLTALSVSLGLWGRWRATKSAKRLQIAARRDVFDHASRLPLHRVYELKSGGVAGILRDDAGALGELLFNLIYNPWRAVLQLGGSLAILAWVDWKLLVLGLAALPLTWFTHRTWIGRIRPLWREARKTRQDIDATSTETFGGMRVVRAFNRRAFESTAFTQRSGLLVRQEVLSWWWSRGIDTAWALIIPVCSALLLLYGSFRILADREQVAAGVLDAAAALTVGDLFVFLTYLTALLSPIAQLAGSATGLQNGLAALDRVLDLLEEPAEFADSPDVVRVDKHTAAGAIELRDVSFHYPRTDRPVLEDVSLYAEPGTTVALVGPSGAGKTTLCNLVARFYDPTEGRVLLDGVDLRDIAVASFRSLLGVVEQDVFLFDGSVADNIAYARRDATAEEIAHAARLANAHDFITEMPEGYATLIGERGVKLSGGQRQRLAIARALLADPRILILDEATSNLDTESERLIQRSLATLMQGRTCFVIAHRLSTIRHADQILVLHHGRIAERGTHDELLEAGGLYAGMVEMQTSAAGGEETRRFADSASA